LKEKESSLEWLKEQWKEVEADIEKRLRAKVELVRGLVNRPVTIPEEEEGEASG
jgi:hypothetical protein